MKKKNREYSKTMTTITVSLFSTVAILFVIFVCYEMHRQNDLTPVSYIGPSLAGILVLIIRGYLRRAEAKSKNDLEWEKTKQLTKFREKHPEHFTQCSVPDTDDYEGGIG